ncbi:MAG: ATP-binding cassette domain-containing protein [Treponema sp.]|nr:ATP-binding cassette domain-containing protein [Treponema sp.]
MLELRDIHVKYSYKTVLNGINLSFQDGKIYSLLGENGAGKSTTAKVICGSVRPTSGQLILDGRGAVFDSPHAALRAGICCVQQRPALAEGISVYENLKLGQGKFNGREAATLLDEWLPGRKASLLVRDLTQEEGFFVSLVNALLKKPRVLVLDEPPYIPPEKLRALTKSGMIIILITHHLRESLQKSDKIILLQDGLVLEEKNANELSEEYIAEKLYGLNPQASSDSDFIKTDLSEDDFFEKFGGNPKIGYIPSDIAMRASNPNLTILQLLTARHTDLPQKELISYAQKLLEKASVNIKLNEKAYCLSGGMLQRLVLERELAEKPRELYLFNPAHGLDVSATERLFTRLRKLTAAGTKVYFGKGKIAE